MSAATITKRADELKPGDVLQRREAFGNAVVLRVGSIDMPNRLAVKHFSLTLQEVDNSYFAPDDMVQVEAPALTPAQQHAEELLRLVRAASDSLRDFEMTPGSAFTAARKGFVETASELLAKIDPPAPPTLEEALELLQDMHRNGAFDADYGSVGRPQQEKARNFLDRARRAGVMKP